MAKKWENFSKEQLEQFVKSSRSNREVAEKCGYTKDSTTSIKEMISFYNFDTSHFTGQGWKKGDFDYSRFQKGKLVKNGEGLKALIALRGHICESCKRTEWLGNNIPLEMHHIDGDNLNNELSNLQLLCPNCHALTKNYRGKNIDKKKETISEEEFVNALKESSNIRQALIKLGLTAKGGNYKRANELIIKYQITHLLQ